MAENPHRDDLVALGKAAFKEGRYEEAVAHLAPAAEADLTDPGVLALLGAAYSFLGRHAAGIAAFERALELQPDNAQAHYNLAVAFEQAGRADDAAVHYRKATELDPNHAASAKALRRLAPAAPAPQVAAEAAPKPAPARARRRAWPRRAAAIVLAGLAVIAAGGAGAGIGWTLSASARQRRAEERAEKCRRNLEGLVQALLAYAHASDDTLPDAADWISATSYLPPGWQQDSPLHCPSDSGSGTSYAMNPALSGKRLNEIGSPDQTILLYEVRRGRPVRRHRGAAFYAFADGHVDRFAEAPDHLWRLKRPAGIWPVDPGRLPPPPPPPEETGPAEEGEAQPGEPSDQAEPASTEVDQPEQAPDAGR
jgi:prepilin-type processing-associated H-X9-DG protein